MRAELTPVERKSLVFPGYEAADEDGLIGVGGDLSVEMLYEAYSHGIFPWPQQNLPLLWFCPDPRGVLHFNDLHFSKSDLKYFRKMKAEMTFNQNFEGVIRRCAEISRPHQPGTWITEEMIEGYLEFHKAGFAHSIECLINGDLAGGLYFVYCEGVVSAESMFFEVPQASKRCVWELTKWAKNQNVEWIDCQMVTPITEKLGARYITRTEYLTWVKERQWKQQKK